MSLRDRSNPTVAYSRPAATFIILHFPCVLFSEGGLGCIASQAVMKYAITIRKNKTGLEIILNRFVVPRTRLELTRANAHHPLKVACLPIPPRPHSVKILHYFCQLGNTFKSNSLTKHVNGLYVFALISIFFKYF